MSAVEQLKSVLCGPDGKCCIAGSDEDRAIIDRALRALEQPAVEPYGWHVTGSNELLRGEYAQSDAESDAKRYGGTARAVALYTAPQAQQPAVERDPWKGLSDVQWVDIMNANDAWHGYTVDEALREAVKLTESKLKTNNTATPPPADVPLLTDQDIGEVLGFGEYTTASTRTTMVGIARTIEQVVRQKVGLKS